MLSARCFIRLPVTRETRWKRLLLVTADETCNHRASYVTQKPTRTIKTQKTIVRVNSRKAPTEGRRSASQAPPPSSAPTSAAPSSGPRTPSAPYVPPPPPPQPSRQNKQAWIIAAGAVGAIGSAIGLYLYNQKNDEAIVPEKESKKPKVVRVPATIAELPESVQYLLVGGGTASFAAFRAIKSNQPKAQILVITEEEFLPYMRPPLSKEIWRNTELPELDQLSFQQWNGNRRSLFYESGSFYADVASLPTLENGGVGVARGYRVTRVDPARREATVTAEGQPDRVIKYDKCLIATGVRPNNVEVLSHADAAVRERCVLLRTVRDAARLWRQLETADDVVLVGGGLLGSEMAYALAAAAQVRGHETRITQVFREAGNLAHILPEYLARWTTRQLQKYGVTVLTDSEIKSTRMNGKRVSLELTSGDTLEADIIVVGAGSTPNTELAGASGLETHPQLGGLLVNAELQARTDLYAAGDVACFYDPALGRRRVEHHDHAVVSGRLAGENMAGANPPKHYLHQSMFWSDLGPEIGLEFVVVVLCVLITAYQFMKACRDPKYNAIGIIDSNLPTVAVFAEQGSERGADAVRAAQQSTTTQQSQPSEEAVVSVSETPERVSLLKDPEDSKYEKGVIFYMEGKRIVGVLMWNLFNRMSIARQLLSQGEEYEDLNEVAKLFELHRP